MSIFCKEFESACEHSEPKRLELFAENAPRQHLNKTIFTIQKAEYHDPNPKLVQAVAHCIKGCGGTAPVSG
jgi:hypothetical protein